MSIEVRIVIPDEGMNANALNDHMAVFGFTRGFAVADPEALLERIAASQKGMADAVASQPKLIEQPAEAPRKTRGKAKDAAPSISTTPEDREPPEDDAETQEQDAADEAAEVEAARPAAAPLTVEDVMGAVGGYVEKFGLPAAQEDGPNIFVSALGKPPSGEPYWKKSLLATATQDQLQKALVAWKTAAAAEQRFVARGA